jgi:hypothetical protein
MQQIEIYLKGERDYKKIVGGTGPLVYPGAHVWIYKQLYRLTDKGQDIQRAQYIFALIYLATLALVFQCYRKAKVCSTDLHKKATDIDGVVRFRRMSSHCSSCQSGCIAFSCSDASTIVLRCWACGLQSTATSATSGIWEVSSTLPG